MTQTNWKMIWCLAVGITVVNSASCGTDTYEYESPEAVYKAFQSNIENEEYVAAAHCLVKESQKTFAGIIMPRIAHVFAGDEAKMQDVQDILEKHNLGACCPAFYTQQMLSTRFAGMSAFAKRL